LGQNGATTINHKNEGSAMFSRYVMLLLLTLPLASQAQPILYTFNGDSASDWFGYSVSGVGDVNNDGYDDVIVGAHQDDNNGIASGSARVLSGINGSILYTFSGDSANDYFGYSVSGAGDVNNDGYHDVIAGAYQDDNNGSNSGSARVFSGLNGSILYTFNGDSANDNFGYSVSGAGDVNGDGYADLVVGAHKDDNTGADSGSARVLSGINGSILYTFNGVTSDQLGWSVSGAGDVNNDGYSDVIAGAYTNSSNGTASGRARVWSGINGSILYTFNGDSASDWFGYSVSGAGDVNNDGYDDVIVGAYYDDNTGTSSGSARVLSGINGSILYTFNGENANDLFGSAVSDAGDVNNDGYADVIVGAFGDDTAGEIFGAARILSGVDGGILYTFNGDSASDSFGYSVSGAGDVDGDGYGDLIVGAYYDDNNNSDSGSVRVFKGKGLWVDTDNDGLNDAVDTDDDNDSIQDINDVAPSNPLVAGDPDNDGVDSVIDNCTNVANPDQLNTDGDSQGNACDNDDDNDGVIDTGDSFPQDVSRSAGNNNIIFIRHADGAGDYFGYSVSGAGDVNNDGYADVLVGAYKDDNTGTDSGSAWVLSGVDNSILYLFNGGDAGDYFGQSVSDAGDVNNDGYADVIVGAINDDNTGSNVGSASVFNGADGSLLYVFNGESTSDYFGYAVSSAGDVDNDGYADLVVGAYGDDNNGSDSGAASVFSGKTGAILHVFNGDNIQDNFGVSVSGAGDLNNDGYDDVIVGAHRASKARVFSGADGSILYTFIGDSIADDFGRSVSAAGDVNSDGYSDVIVGAWYNDAVATDTGMVRVFSGSNGSVLYTFYGDTAGDQLGLSVSGVGDVNNDGYDDVIAGAYQDDNNGSNSGSARILSGINGSILYVFNGDNANDSFGAAVSGAGDVNNDGYDDMIVGAYRDDNGGTDSGSVRVLNGKGLWIDTDFDGQNDAIDTDDDSDGELDINDLMPVDTDNDAIWNGLDWDDDNDGVPDVVDAAPLDIGITAETSLPLDAIYKGSKLGRGVLAQ